MNRSDSADTAPATGLTETPGDYGFPPGTSVGRYVLGERLGAGGMGVVYAAHDRKLDRAVALKLLRPDASGHVEAHRQLVREAQTLARLAHPNVVNVHDIGDFEGRVYVDMELVTGRTLAQWLEAGERPWEVVLDVFLQAGRGLAAAHAVGIVHRDFKPDNVLVGDDGRVRVADFGIALLGPRPQRAFGEPAGDGANEASSESETTTGAPVVRSHSRSIGRTGTPAYMAPEQRRDGTADARSDQYSFCVALHEAMCGERPRDSSKSGKSNSPPAAVDRKPPPWLEQAIARGLSKDPDQRYPSMDALLETLVSEPRRRRQRRRLAAMSVAAAGFLAAGVGWGSAHNRASAPPLCRGAEAKLAGVWDAERKDAVQRAFLAVQKPFAADAWSGVQRALDAYATAWVATRTEACEATRVRGEQSDQILGLRMACLDDRAAALNAVSEVFSHADEGVVLHAFGAAQELPRLAPCSDTKWLLARVKPPADPATAAKVAELHVRLARVKALDDSAQYSEALPIARGLVADAEPIGDRQVQAEALYALGSLLGRTSDLAGAEPALRQAASVADAAGDDALRVRAWGALLFYTVGEGGKFDLIPVFQEEAKGALARLGGDDDVEANYLEDLGAAFLSAGKLAEARQSDEKAAEIEARTFGHDSWQEAIALTNLGIAHAAAGEGGAALDALEGALAIDERQLGPSHPHVASAENAMGGALMEEGKPAEAEPHARRAVSVADGTLGEEELSRYVFDLGEVLVAEGKLDDALASYQRALALMSKARAAEDPTLISFLRGVGETYLSLGKPALGVPYLERAVAIPEEGQASDMARAEFALARALVDARTTRPRARTFAEKARASLAKSESPDDAKLASEIGEWLARGAPASR